MNRYPLYLQEIAKQPTRNLTDKAITAISQSRKYVNHLPQMIDELQSLKSAAEEKEGTLYSLTPVYKKKYLDDAENHATKLRDKTKEYKK